LKGAGAGVATLALGGAGIATDRLIARSGAGNPRAAAAVARLAEHPIRKFHSRPDLRPPRLAMTGTSAEPHYLFVGPGNLGSQQGGPMIVSQHGQPLWFKPLRSPMWESNFMATTYQGQPVLSWWEGYVLSPIGYGYGEGVIVDASYREIARVRAANGRQADVHEFRLTPDGTALLTCYPQTVEGDLSSIGGPRNGRVLESVFQEIDVRTGRLLMEWRSLDHIPVSESYRPPADPYDYLHVNSIDLAPDGNLIVSARHGWAIYKLDRRTGAVIWRLGGKRSDFALADGAQFTWQHHVRQLDDSTFTVFDNGSDGRINSAAQSRGLVLDVDSGQRTVRVRASYQHPDRLLASSMGSVELLDGGHVLVGWGSEPYASEFTSGGQLVSDARMPKGDQSYRAFRLPWTGVPRVTPAIAARPDPSTGHAIVYASWNGATQVSHWQAHAGPSPARLHQGRIAPRRGFETRIPLERGAGYAAVIALDASGRQLAKSRTIRL
jgi:hypothetical protein